VAGEEREDGNAIFQIMNNIDRLSGRLEMQIGEGKI
jgi:hypothetical protein